MSVLIASPASVHSWAGLGCAGRALGGGEEANRSRKGDDGQTTHAGWEADRPGWLWPTTKKLHPAKKAERVACMWGGV